MPNAIVTGGTQGIGKATVEKLLSEGFTVATCARNEEDLNNLKAQWTDQYPDSKVITIKTDLSKKEEVLAFAAQVKESFKTIDILVNNAGIYYPGNIYDEPDGSLEQMLSTNLLSVYHLTRALLPQLKAQRSGYIFNICSVASLKAYPGGGSYSISKYALLGFSENLREELKADNIKVVSLCPGATNSRSWEGSGIDPERIMDPTDVSEMIWATYTLSSKANVEMLVMRPQLGDL